MLLTATVNDWFRIVDVARGGHDAGRREKVSHFTDGVELQSLLTNKCSWTDKSQPENRWSSPVVRIPDNAAGAAVRKFVG